MMDTGELTNDLVCLDEDFDVALTMNRILAWNKLALSQEGRSVLGTKAKLSGSNLFTHLNYWIVPLGGQVLVTSPEINSVEVPSSATIVCQGDTFTLQGQ